jgi:hypothetical protein
MDTVSALLTIALVVGLVVAVPTLLVGRAMRKQVDAMHSPPIVAEYASAGFAVSMSGSHGAPVVEGVHKETPFVLALIPGMGATRAETRLSTPRVSGGDFEVAREGSRDLSGRDTVASQFPDPAAQQALRLLFGLGYDAVYARDGKVGAARYFRAELPSVAKLRQAIEQLAVLRSL